LSCIQRLGNVARRLTGNVLTENFADDLKSAGLAGHRPVAVRLAASVPAITNDTAQPAMCLLCKVFQVAIPIAPFKPM
jgi:hypothetical protein